jgi:hypothetical protein
MKGRMKKDKALLVTTAHKGVFFGYGNPSDGATIELTKARMCVYWDSALRGVMGLAATGPNGNCKIGPAVDKITIRDVTMVAECSENAVTNWEKGLWS